MKDLKKNLIGNGRTLRVKTTPDNVREAHEGLFHATMNLPTAAAHCGSGGEYSLRRPRAWGRPPSKCCPPRAPAYCRPAVQYVHGHGQSQFSAAGAAFGSSAGRSDPPAGLWLAGGACNPGVRVPRYSSTCTCSFLS